MDNATKTLFVWLASCLLFTVQPTGLTLAQDQRPNILFCIADDWGWPHAGAYGDPVVKTPNFDRLAKEGVLFNQAYVSSPSCTPSRNAILTGQYHWRLGWGANLWSKLDTKHQTYPHLLAAAGYEIGHYRKSWGPGKLDNWKLHPAGKRFDNFGKFLKGRSKDKPFCFWFGAHDPHRGYKAGSGKDSGMDLTKIKLFDHFPDSIEVRSDVADYYFEVQRFDRDVGKALEQLKSAGLLENTIVVVTGDHGMPFPRCKANLYDSGARVPLVVRWPARFKPDRKIDDFVSLTDLAPTFLELGKAQIPKAVTGKNLLPVLQSGKSGLVDETRKEVFTGKERHTPGQEAPDRGGTPMRAVRTHDFLLIRNFKPERWPAGTPNWDRAFIRGCWFSDCDNGPSKTYIVENRDRDEEHQKKYELCFGKRPEFELYDLKKDKGQVINVAYVNAYLKIRQRLERTLQDKLIQMDDPRIKPGADKLFDSPEYFGSGPRHPDWRNEQNRKKREQKTKRAG